MEKMLIKVVANAHARGGGEMSAQHILHMLKAKNIQTIFHPLSHIDNHFVVPPGIKVIPFSAAPSTGINCDLLFFYANDGVYRLEKDRQQWERILRSARRRVVCLNFTMGPAKNEWFRNLVSKAIFLSTEKRDEYVKLGFTGPTEILAPPVLLDPFLKIKRPDPPVQITRFARCSRFSGKFDEKDHRDIMRQVWQECPDTKFLFMASPPWMKIWARQEHRISALSWDEMSVPDLLSWGEIFWYRLPKNMRDQGPRVIVEAMASGLPCVVDNRDGAKDRVTDKTGWLCNNNDEYVEAMVHAVKNPSAVKAKGEAARKWAMEHFRPEKWVDAITGALSL
jgi:glycosyltransferase involved in cell wall biosynthesis